MKFIVDAQLPRSLAIFLNNKGIECIHTLDLPAQNRTSDHVIIEIAMNGGYIIIAKDLDFLETFLIKSKPEKLILVKTGNIANKDLLRIFELNIDTILEMINTCNLVEVGQSYISGK